MDKRTFAELRPFSFTNTPSAPVSSPHPIYTYPHYFYIPFDQPDHANTNLELQWGSPNFINQQFTIALAVEERSKSLKSLPSTEILAEQEIKVTKTVKKRQHSGSCGKNTEEGKDRAIIPKMNTVPLHSTTRQRKPSKPLVVVTRDEFQIQEKTFPRCDESFAQSALNLLTPQQENFSTGLENSQVIHESPSYNNIPRPISFVNFIVTDEVKVYTNKENEKKKENRAKSSLRFNMASILCIQEEVQANGFSNDELKKLPSKKENQEIVDKKSKKQRTHHDFTCIVQREGEEKEFAIRMSKAPSKEATVKRRSYTEKQKKIDHDYCHPSSFIYDDNDALNNGEEQNVDMDIDNEIFLMEDMSLSKSDESSGPYYQSNSSDVFPVIKLPSLASTKEDIFGPMPKSLFFTRKWQSESFVSDLELYTLQANVLADLVKNCREEGRMTRKTINNFKRAAHTLQKYCQEHL